MMTSQAVITEYCRSHDISVLEGLTLISQAVKQATNSVANVMPIEDDRGEIGFFTQTSSGEFRSIEMRPNFFSKARKKLESLVQQRQFAQEIEQLQTNKQDGKIARGTVIEEKANGRFINLPNIRAFLPLGEAIEQEASQGCYEIGQSLYFAIISSDKERSGKPRVILSRRGAYLAASVADT
jgi:ribosomal protein S1